MLTKADAVAHRLSIGWCAAEKTPGAYLSVEMVAGLGIAGAAVGVRTRRSPQV